MQPFNIIQQIFTKTRLQKTKLIFFKLNLNILKNTFLTVRGPACAYISVLASTVYNVNQQDIVIYNYDPQR